MASSFNDISRIFISELANTGIEVDGAALLIADKNLDFDTLGVEFYVAPFLLTAPVVQASLGDGGCDRHSGIFQITIFQVKGGALTDLYSMADLLNAAFPSGSDISVVDSDINVRITNNSVSALQIDERWATLPLNIEYFAYTERVAQLT